VDRKDRRQAGFTLLEVVMAVSVLVLGIIALGGVMVVSSRHREAIASKSQVLEETQSLFELIKSSDPSTLEAAYDGKTFTVKSPYAGGAGSEAKTAGQVTITTNVDTTNARLPVVTLRAEWLVGAHTESLDMRTEVYNASGGSGPVIDPILNKLVTWDADIIDLLLP
jgi:Tfp pilus assembly protein PilV